MKLLRALFVLALVLAVAAPVYAETQNVKVSGSIDAYWFYRNNFDLRDNNDIGVVPAGTTDFDHGAVGDVNYKSEGDEYFMSITQIEVAADLTDNVSTVINLINQRDWNANSFAAIESVATPIAAAEFDILLDLAYVQMKEIFYSPLTLTIGRQDLLFGRGFIIGWNPQDPQGATQADEFTQIQSFDAIRATLDFNPWTLDFVYSKIDENAHNPEDDRDLYIANVNYKFAEYNAVAEGYFVSEIDRATNAPTATVSQESNKTHTIGGRVQFDPISQITLGGELAYQFGNYRAALANPDRDRSAWAVDIFGTHRWDYTWKPDITLEYVLMSGESDLSATTAEFGGWNGPFRGPTYGWIHEYLETYYGTASTNDQATGQNMEHVSVTGAISPLEDLKLSGTFYYIWSPDDMHTTTTNPNTSVLSDEQGWEIDTSIVYAYTEDVTFSFYANWFKPGDMYTSPDDETASEYISRVTVVF